MTHDRAAVIVSPRHDRTCKSTSSGALATRKAWYCSWFPRGTQLAPSCMRYCINQQSRFLRLPFCLSLVFGLTPPDPCRPRCSATRTSSSLSFSPSEDETELSASFFALVFPFRLSEPFFTPTFKPCLRNALSKPLLARIPGKSLAVYTLKTSVMALATFPCVAPTCMLLVSTRKSRNLSRYLPGDLQLKSGKTKKVPAIPFSSFAWYGDATRLPMSLLVVGTSGCADANSVSSAVPSGLKSVQWSASIALRSCSGNPVTRSVILSSRIGGGSMTRRSRSPNPQALAATGCCRMVRLKSSGGALLAQGFEGRERDDRGDASE